MKSSSPRPSSAPRTNVNMLGSSQRARATKTSLNSPPKAALPRPVAPRLGCATSRSKTYGPIARTRTSLI
eukprot:1643731-Pleurochrysis_carterae.AAC.1